MSWMANSGYLEGIYRVDSITMRILSYSMKGDTGAS
jgi:hypothetical protein